MFRYILAAILFTAPAYAAETPANAGPSGAVMTADQIYQALTGLGELDNCQDESGRTKFCRYSIAVHRRIAHDTKILREYQDATKARLEEIRQSIAGDTKVDAGSLKDVQINLAVSKLGREKVTVQGLEPFTGGDLGLTDDKNGNVFAPSALSNLGPLFKDE